MDNTNHLTQVNMHVIREYNPPPPIKKSHYFSSGGTAAVSGDLK